MSDPLLIRGIQEAVTIPVMAKARIGHFAEAQVLEALEVDYIDESEVLTPADEANHIDKWAFKVPFVCGATNLGEALRRIGEGAAMIRSKGEAGTGDIVEAVRHMRRITGEIRALTVDGRHGARDRRQGAPGAARPRPRRSPRTASCRSCCSARRHRHAGRRRADDAARRRGRLRRLGHLQVRDPATRARAIVEATTHFADPERVAQASEGLGEAMVSLETRKLEDGPAARRPRLVGVLALQGDFEAHARVLRALGAESREVRTPADLDGARRRSSCPGGSRRR